MRADHEKPLMNAQYLDIDVHFARFMSNLGETRDPQLYQLFAQLSQALRQQHSCIDLGQRPNTADWVAKLQALPCVGQPNVQAIDREALKKPLILENNRLYLHRYYQYERRIAADLIRRNQPSEGVDPTLLREILTPLFDGFAGGHTEIDWQAVAVLQALTRRLTIITGGPGTGKTSTVAKLLQAFSALPGQEQAVIKLAAPTGKAAMRLKQGLRQAESLLIRGSLVADEFAVDAMSARPAIEVQTLHRLLGMRLDGKSWRHDERYPLTADLLIIDEVSMIDLAMMDRLLRALPSHCRLVLLGDPDQLPSVETGNFLMDICQYSAGYSPALQALATSVLGANLTVADGEHKLRDAFCRLTKSYRFAAQQGIGRTAQAIQQGLPVEASNQVSLCAFTDLAVNPELLLAPYRDYLRLVASPDVSAEQLLDLFEQTRILAAVREGDFGVEQLNEAIEAQLLTTGFRTNSAFYQGRPIMIRRNDYSLGLFNGDVGICLLNDETQQWYVAFRDGDGTIMTYLASRLPPHETCFVMTVHKSQGSEFKTVTLVLAEVASSTADPLVTRELLYTAVTRARQHITLYSTPALLNQALNNRARRNSGLGERFF